MANNFNVSNLVSRQVVQSLHARGILINTVNKSYSKDFTQKGYRPGQTIEINIQHQPSITKGTVGTVQDIVDRKTSVTIDQYNGVFKWTSLEKGYDMEEVRRYADSIAMRLIREMEVTGFQTLMENVGQSTGTPGVEPGALKTWGEARAKITSAIGPDRKYYAAASPLAMVELTDSLKNANNPGKQISNQFLSNRMKDAAGCYFYESQSIGRHAAGTATNSTPVTNGAGQTGNTLSIDGLGAGKTVTAGTHFTLDGIFAIDPETKIRLSYLREFVVTADTTADGGGAIAALPISPEIFNSLSPHQNISQDIGDGVALTFTTVNKEVSSSNVVYDKDAITLVSVPLPAANTKNTHSFGNYNGMQIRVGMGAWDVTNDTEALRVDAVWGWSMLRPDHACIVEGA